VGEKELFHQITFGLEKGQKSALIARNGTGKSTLLNIIAGFDTPDEGQVIIRNDIVVSYLPQRDDFQEDNSVLDALFDADTPVLKAIKEYETCVTLMENGHADAVSQERMEKAISDLDRLQAWDYESKVKEILSKFGINDVLKNVGELSGGQRKKAALAKTLIADTDLLILDEPTNHLDIEMTEWLENYLSSANITLLMVTHDRSFLDRVCNDIFELSNGQLYHYRGKYDYFLEKKAERLANAAAEHEKLRQLYRKELAWVHTSPQARTSKARARINNFEKLQEQVNVHSEAAPEAFKVQAERIGVSAFFRAL
jgi:ATP-binding cassette subfamily F protein uup